MVYKSIPLRWEVYRWNTDQKEVTLDAGGQVTGFALIGFRFYRDNGVVITSKTFTGYSPPWWCVTIPHYALVLLFAITPIITFRRMRRNRRARQLGQKLCPNCQYDYEPLQPVAPSAAAKPPPPNAKSLNAKCEYYPWHLGVHLPY